MNLNTGARYNLSTDSWTPTNVPTASAGHTAVWTGSEMIVWGGKGSGCVKAKYDGSIGGRRGTSNTNAPDARASHAADWTGSQMMVWGGITPPSTATASPSTIAKPSPSTNITGFLILTPPPRGTGGRYDPITDSWTATSTTNAPYARNSHTAVWTGSEMIVWGGVGADYFNTGGRYNPTIDGWTATSTPNAPAARYDHTADWTGSQMIVLSGADNNTIFNTGGRYHPSTNTWLATSTTNAPAAREAHTAVWTGSEMIVWAGY